MKTRRHLIAALALPCACLLAACGREAGEAGTPQGAAPPDVAKAVAQANAAGQAVQTLDWDQLLSPAEAARLAGRPEAEAKRSRLQQPVNSLHFSWQSTRTRTLASGLRLPVEDEIQVMQPAVRVRTDEASFRRQHLQAADPAQVERALGALRSSERYKTMSADQQAMAERMMRNTADQPAMQAVEGVGEAAAWDAQSRTLFLLHKGMVLGAMAHVSDQDPDNLRAATELARLVVGRI